MKKRRLFSLGIVLCLCIGLLGGCGSEASTDSTANTDSESATYNWRFAVSEGTESVQAYWATTFVEKLKEINPNINIEIFYGGQLGDAVECNEMCINGLIEFVTADPANMSSFIPEMQCFALHFFWPNNDAVVDDVLANSDAITGLVSDLYAEKGLTLLAMHNLGWDLWTANRPLQTVSDFSGLKVRVMQSPMIIHSYELYGANPTPIAFSETYSALQLGTADAEENPAQSIVEAKFYEVQDYLTLSRHAIMPGAIAVNSSLFDTLPSEIQDQIREAAAYTQSVFPAGREEIDTAKLEEIQEMSDMTFLELDEAAREEFAAVAEPAIDYYISEYGGERGQALVEALQSAIEEAETRLG